MYRNLTYLLMFFSVALWINSVPAQDDPFDTTKKDAAKTAEKDEVPLSLQRKREHPVIVSLKEHPPKTLSEVMRALKLTFEISRPVEFKQFATQWLGLKPSDEQLIAFHDQYGGALFWQMSQQRDFAPEGREIGELVIDAAANHAQNTTLLSAEVAKLYAENTRKLALQRLAQGGTAGVNAILKASAAAKSAEEHEQLRNALVALRKDSIGPCIAALQANSEDVRLDAIHALGRLKSTEAILYLVGPAVGAADEADRNAAYEALSLRAKKMPSKSAVEAFLEKRIRNYLAGDFPVDPDVDNLIPLWQWNDKEQIAELKRFEREDASLLVADRLAKQLARLAPENAETVRLTMLVRLETERNLQGLDSPPSLENSAYADAKKLSVEVLEQILLDALNKGRFGAAVSAVEILGASGRPELLTRSAQPHSPLVDALLSPDQRTQFAALRAILALADEHDYPGSSRVMETADYLLTGQGTPRILVAHPRLEESRRIATLISELGYNVETAGNGSELVRLAKANADYEMILVSDTLNRPSVLESTQMLRHDIRSAWIPLGIMMQDAERDETYWNDPTVMATGNLIGGLNIRNAWTPTGTIRARGAEWAKQADARAEIISPPHSTETARWQLQSILKRGGRSIVPGEVRAEHAALVLDELTKLVSAKYPPKYYDLHRFEQAFRSASDNPQLTQRAFRALGELGSPPAQLFLAEQASLVGRSEEDRKIAVEALGVAVKKRGLLLTQARLEQQYKLYNEKVGNDQTSSAILGDLLDVVESPRKERMSLEKLRKS